MKLQTLGLAVKRSARRFRRDERGVSAIFIAILLSSMIGLLGLGIESGLWFSQRRQYQSAADAGAIAGAHELAAKLTASGGLSGSVTTTSAGLAWKEAVNNGAPNSS